MAVLQNPLFGTIVGSIGGVTYRGRMGQNTIARKPINTTLAGVKNMTDDQLGQLAGKTKYNVDQLKRFRAAQQSLDSSVSACRKKDLSGSEFAPTKPGETRFNRCVAKEQKAAIPGA